MTTIEKMKTIILVAVMLLLGGGASAFALSLEALIAPEQAAVLIAGGTLGQVQFKTLAPALLPRYDLVQQLLEACIAEVEPSLLVESLHRYKKPPGAAFPHWSAEERRALFNETIALSTLAGLRYYSASRKTMRVFYETSQVIDGPDTKKPVADPFYAEPPQELALYARQKDLTFGDNIYHYVYHTREDALLFVQQNLTPLLAGIIPAIGRHKLRSVVAVIDAEDGLLIYVASIAKAVSLPGINQRVGQSFTTRTDALMGWFTERADAAFKRLIPE
ncbi:MAG: hypothetical protein LBQ30_06700 [Treponema sp.]|jgi:hypothetical protein|nr:hypothetical protein [Treponema sp.]